jgi:HEAT repeat protein
VDTRWSSLEKRDSSMVSQPVIWEEQWNWLSGRIGSLSDSKPDDADTIKQFSLQFEEKGEPAALNAAYELSSRGAGGTAALLQLLHHDNVRVSRMAAYGLSVSGQRAISGLILALDDERDETVNNAVFALGELRGLAATAVPKIVHLLSTRGERVRSTVAEALGLIAEPVKETVDGLIQCLRDPDEQVRFTAALSLLRMGPAAKAAVSELEKALDDDNRYVRGHAAEALRAIDTEEAREILMKELFNLRWCSTTTKASTF